MIDITEKAHEKLVEKTRKAGENIIRIGLLPAGCNGWKYEFVFVTDSNADDHIIDYGDYVLVIETGHLHNFMNMTLDYQTKGLNSEFKIVNTNEVAYCGCGQSISF